MTAGAQGVDVRLLPMVLALWAGAFTGLAVAWPAAVACAGVAAAVTWLALRHLSAPARRRAVAAAGSCLAVGLVVGAARSAPVRDGPVSNLAEAEAYVHVEAVVTDDPELRLRGGTAGESPGADQPNPDRSYVLTRIRVERVTGRGVTHRLRVPVLVIAGVHGVDWADLLPGQHIRVGGIVEPDLGNVGDVAAVLRPRGSPQLVGGPSVASRGTEPFRAGLRRSVSGLGPDARALVPGLVVGDESLMTDDLRGDMKTSGLTHLTAVSGTNVTLILLVVLALARWAGVRGYALAGVGVLGVAGFVLLARPDPSVLRAAAMGVVAVVGLTVAGRRRGLSALGTAVLLLILVDPWLARSVGFALSVVATAGILTLVPMWRRALWWLPGPLAVAVAVPLAAQVACTPLILAVSGELSLASLPANVLAAAAVAPATVFGVAAAVLSPVLPVVASWCAWLAGLPAWWIAAVAHWFADQPGAAVPWMPGAAGVVVSVVLVTLAVTAMPAVLRRPLLSTAAAAILAFGVLRTFPSPGWPPPGWLVVACDVGQGDAVVLRVRQHTAVVVDAGREPGPVRRCLDSLGVREVPLLVLSHFDIDHVGGVPGVLAGRQVGRSLVSPLPEPAHNAGRVRQWLDTADVPVDVARVGERLSVGESLSLEVVWPRGPGDPAESASNNASVVLDAEVGGFDVLLTGDVEPSAQRALLRSAPGLDADVLKVAHHGSPHQHPDLLTELGARVALISVGENTYGHPSSRVLATLRSAGVRTYRTDEDGSVAVVRIGAGELGVVTRGARSERRRAADFWGAGPRPG